MNWLILILLIVIIIVTIMLFTIKMGGSFNEKTLKLFEEFETNTANFKRKQALSLFEETNITEFKHVQSLLLLSNYKNILEKCKTAPVKEDLEHPLIGQEYRAFMFLLEYADTLNNCHGNLKTCIDNYKNVIILTPLISTAEQNMVHYKNYYNNSGD